MFKDVVCWSALRDHPFKFKGDERAPVDPCGAADSSYDDNEPHRAALRSFCEYCVVQKAQNVLRNGLPQHLWGQQVLSILTVRATRNATADTLQAQD